MAKLTEKHQVLLVECLARFMSVQEAAAELKARYGIEAPARQVSFYDPTTVCGAAGLAQKWKDLFAEARARYIADEESIPIAHRANRLRRLQALLDDPRSARNPNLVTGVLEQAAKEMGGGYTNRREVSGPGGAPIELKHDVEELRKLPAEELVRLHRETLG